MATLVKERGRRRTFFGTALAFAAALFALWLLTGESANANHQPADKIAVAGSAPDVVGPASDVVLLESRMKTSAPTDLMIQFSSECALFTDTTVKPQGKLSTAEATARVEAWVEIDATPDDDSDDASNSVVKVASNDTAPAPTDISLDNDVPPAAGPGRVVLCHRTQGLQAALDFSDAGLLEDESFIRLYQGTRDAQAFNWIRLNMGSGTYEIELHAQIVDEINTSGGGTASAKGVVGKRTLVVEPAKLANDAEL